MILKGIFAALTVPSPLSSSGSPSIAGKMNSMGAPKGTRTLSAIKVMLHQVTRTLWALAHINEQLIMLWLQERRHMKRFKLLESGLTNEERKTKQQPMQWKDKVPFTSPKTEKK